MKTALILNNTHSEFEFIKFLKKKYDKVFTLGNKIPFLKEKKIQHFKLDYKNSKKINAIINKYKILHIFPGSNDLTLFSLSKLKNKFVDDIKKVRILHNKFFFRKFEKDIKIISWQSIKNNKKTKYPILLKPKIGHGGKGIAKIENEVELKKILKKNKKNFFLEEYKNGTHHGVFTLICKQKLVFTFFDTEQRFINPFTVSSTINSCLIPQKIQKKIKNKISSIAKKLKLADGILHLQIIYNSKEKKFYIVEITRRMPGDNYLTFIKRSTNLPVEEYIYNLFLNKKLKIKKQHKKFILRKVLMSSKNGRYRGVKISRKIINNIIEKKIFVKKNYKINDFMQKRLGVIFLKFKNEKLMVSFAKNIDNHINVIIK